jgi:hypothetical protein
MLETQEWKLVGMLIQEAVCVYLQVHRNVWKHRKAHIDRKAQKLVHSVQKCVLKLRYILCKHNTCILLVYVVQYI